jgi:hypothetical protein
MKHFIRIVLLITLGLAIHALLAVAASPAYATGNATPTLTPLNLQDNTFVISGLFVIF